jgi:carbon-monoxide dehydrogenase large subunit
MVSKLASFMGDHHTEKELPWEGLSQVLFERVEHDPESGQLLTGSFMDYCMPRADDVCAMEVGSNPVSTKLNPLGVKGAGEAGTVGALLAVMNAIMDALAPLGMKGVRHARDGG